MRPYGSLLFLFATVLLPQATAALTTYQYTGHISGASRNDIGFPVPLGEPVTVEFTYDPLAPPTNPNNAIVRQYKMSGDGISFQVRIGDHLSTPIHEYSINVWRENGTTDDQFNFLNFEGTDYIPINFPGFLEGARSPFFFRRGIPPLTSTALFLSQPDPADFNDVRLNFQKRVDGDLVLHFRTQLDPLFIPEPSTSMLASMSLLWCICSTRRLFKDKRRGGRL
jgi:hypothetical protein